jgi:hypothetical protein
VGPAYSFQFIGFPSEWGVEVVGTEIVQLPRFQFIGFPSEWGEFTPEAIAYAVWTFPIYWVPQRVGRVGIEGRAGGGVSLFPIYWVPQRVGSAGRTLTSAGRSAGFQFIGFPSEWGESWLGWLDRLMAVVSNLLGSPASGECKWI